MTKIVTASTIALVFLVIERETAEAQEAKPKTFKIEFKVFPANNPTGSSLPAFDRATIHYRNKVESLPDFKFNLPVVGPDARGFYSVTVDEGWLVDNLVIRLKGVVNPAVITKLVTRDNMILYPGASESGEKFKFPAYMTQMGTYRSLFREFVEEAQLDLREVNRLALLDAFKPQLEKMAQVRDRLPDATEEQIATATKLVNEVVRLYFGLADADVPEEVCLQPQIIYYCYPNQRCGLFGRRRGR